MATAPTPDELAPLLDETLADSSGLDEEMPDPYEDEDGEYMAAATAAVGSESKATALKDAIEACLRKHGLLTDAVEDVIESDVGAGFPDL